MTFKKFLIPLLLTAVLCGCGAPKAPQPAGERIAVNADTASYFEAQKRSFQFGYEEDEQTP